MPFRVRASSAARRGRGRIIAAMTTLFVLAAAPAFARQPRTTAPSTAPTPAPMPASTPASALGSGTPSNADLGSLVMLQDGARRLAAASARQPADLPTELAAPDGAPTPQPVPLPASALAGGAGLAGLWVFHLLRRRSHAAHR